LIYDAIVIGGGAAGLFYALTAGGLGKSVLVLEHNSEVGRKIAISGGGRCNFTNRSVGPENFVSRNPHFAKSALSRYTPNDFIDLVRRHKIAYYEKTLGQLFCRDSSREIIAMLLAECRAARVKIELACSVSAVAKDDTFAVETSRGVFRSHNVIVACGGLSFPKVGATDLGYRIARRFGVSIIETRPSLVAMVFDKQAGHAPAGVSVDAGVTAGGVTFRENILFTHRGLSGPAILQASNYWQPSEPVSIRLAPETDVAAALAASGRRGKLNNFLSVFLPAKLAAEIAAEFMPKIQTADLSQKEIERLVARIEAWDVRFRGTEGYDRAEVTLGGVSTDELSSKTMESKRVSGLFFIGEIVDVTGWLGGYNFQWAWASGYAAGTAV
jgi:predicted Rossmann fold flavoprotein